MAAISKVPSDPVGSVERRFRPSGPGREEQRVSRFRENFARNEVKPPVSCAQQDQGLIPNVLSRAEVGQRTLDRIISKARKGATYRPSELLAMQAEVYRISEELTLVNKVVEEGMSGVKRLWNMQI